MPEADIYAFKIRTGKMMKASSPHLVNSIVHPPRLTDVISRLARLCMCRFQPQRGVTYQPRASNAPPWVNATTSHLQPEGLRHIHPLNIALTNAAACFAPTGLNLIVDLIPGRHFACPGLVFHALSGLSRGASPRYP